MNARMQTKTIECITPGPTGYWVTNLFGYYSAETEEGFVAVFKNACENMNETTCELCYTLLPEDDFMITKYRICPETGTVIISAENAMDRDAKIVFYWHYAGGKQLGKVSAGDGCYTSVIRNEKQYFTKSQNGIKDKDDDKPAGRLFAIAWEADGQFFELHCHNTDYTKKDIEKLTGLVVKIALTE